MTSRRANIAIAALAVPVLALGLTGCFSGQKATTNVQATQASGNGVSSEVGNMKINNATLVLGPADSKTATLIMTVSNIGDAEDSVIAATIEGKPATLVPAGSEIIVAPHESQNFGYVGATASANISGLEATVSTYVPVSVTFKNAGTVKMSVMTVDATGIYSGITPAS